MKKIILSAFILPIALLFQSIPILAMNETSIPRWEEEFGVSVIYLEDGRRIVISPVYEKKEGIFIGKTAANIVTKSRDAFCENSNGKIEWKYTLTATFTYEYGISAVCTSTSYIQSIYNNEWSFSDGSATSSENTAHGKGHYTKKVLFVESGNVDVDISLTCDVYGNVT